METGHADRTITHGRFFSRSDFAGSYGGHPSKRFEDRIENQKRPD